MKRNPKKSPLAKAITAALLAACALYAIAEETGSSDALRIGSGPDGKVYQLLVQDMRSMCGNQVQIVNVPSIGGIPNLMKLSANEADLGIVQLDTLLAIGKDGDENIQNLQAVMPLHTNLLHIVSLRGGYTVGELTESFLSWKNKDTREIRRADKFSELKGLRIAAVGSTILLGQRLNSQLGYGMTLVKAESDDEALKWLKEGRVQAYFTDGGWPLPSVARYKSDSGLQLVDYDLPAQPPFSIVKRNYENLGAFKVQFLGSPNLLVTRPFKPNGEMGRKVATLQSCLIRNLENLQEGRFHAAWKEIKNPLDTLGIPRFQGTKAGAR
jgi:TRAP-type uncharacterized transport system substrate-binding protein